MDGMTLLLTAIVLDVTPRPTPDQPWAIESTATVAADGELFDVRLPGGTIGATTVSVSDTPMLRTGATYQLALVQTELGLALAELPIPVNGIDLDDPAPPPYDLAGSSWDHQLDPVELPFSLNTSTWPASFDPDAVEAAMEEALRVWSIQGQSRAELRYGGRTSDTQYGSGSNGLNTTKYEDYHWGSTLAISVRTTVGSEIRDCDLKFYGSNGNGDIHWNVDPNGAPDGQNALRHTLVHEFGHCIGLSHSNVEGALMESYAPDEQGPGSWELHDDDVAGVQALYGTVAAELTIDGGLVDGELRADISNIGDGTAFELEASADGDLVDVELALGDLSAGDSTELIIELADGACGDIEATVVVTDALGDSWEASLEAELESCPRGSNQGESGTGCGCASGSAPGWMGMTLLPLLMRRRRQRQPA